MTGFAYRLRLLYAGRLLPLEAALPPSVSTIVLNKASGTCANEVWDAPTDLATTVAVNNTAVMQGVRALYAAGKSYILMLGLYYCDSTAQFKALIDRYYTPGLVGILLLTSSSSELDIAPWVQRAQDIQKAYPSLRIGCARTCTCGAGWPASVRALVPAATYTCCSLEVCLVLTARPDISGRTSCFCMHEHPFDGSFSKCMRASPSTQMAHDVLWKGGRRLQPL